MAYHNGGRPYGYTPARTITILAVRADLTLAAELTYTATSVYEAKCMAERENAGKADYRDLTPNERLFRRMVCGR